MNALRGGRAIIAIREAMNGESGVDRLSVFPVYWFTIIREPRFEFFFIHVPDEFQPDDRCPENHSGIELIHNDCRAVFYPYGQSHEYRRRDEKNVPFCQ